MPPGRPDSFLHADHRKLDASLESDPEGPNGKPLPGALSCSVIRVAWYSSQATFFVCLDNLQLIDRKQCRKSTGMVVTIGPVGAVTAALKAPSTLSSATAIRTGTSFGLVVVADVQPAGDC